MGVGAGQYMYDVVVKKFTFAISSPDELSLTNGSSQWPELFVPSGSFEKKYKGLQVS